MTAVPPSGVVTFLFTDIEGSTRMWGEETPEDMTGVVLRHLEILVGLDHPRPRIGERPPGRLAIGEHPAELPHPDEHHALGLPAELLGGVDRIGQRRRIGGLARLGRRIGVGRAGPRGHDASSCAPRHARQQYRSGSPAASRVRIARVARGTGHPHWSQSAVRAPRYSARSASMRPAVRT